MERGEVTAQVRFLAEEGGVSERTAWRWFAAMRASGSAELLSRGRECEACGGPLPEGSTIRRRFCDASCRIYQHRHRD